MSGTSAHRAGRETNGEQQPEGPRDQDARRFHNFGRNDQNIESDTRVNNKNSGAVAGRDGALRKCQRPYSGRNIPIGHPTTFVCAARRGADGGGSATCEARRPYQGQWRGRKPP
jgi:hypothetical protein